MELTMTKPKKTKVSKNKPLVETMALAFDPNDQATLAIIKMIESCGLFSVMREDTPNAETLQALDDAHNGKTYKAKNLDDLLNYLEN